MDIKNNYDFNNKDDKRKIKTLGPVPNNSNVLPRHDNEGKTKTLNPVSDKTVLPRYDNRVNTNAEIKNIKTLNDISTDKNKYPNTLKDAFNRATNSVYATIPYTGKSSLRGNVTFDHDVTDNESVSLLVLKKGQEVYFGNESEYSTITEDITIPVTTRKLVDGRKESVISHVDASIQHLDPQGTEDVYEMQSCNDYDCSVADKDGRLRIAEISQPQVELDMYKSKSDDSDNPPPPPPSSSASALSRLFQIQRELDVPSEKEKEKDDDYGLEF